MWTLALVLMVGRPLWAPEVLAAAAAAVAMAPQNCSLSCVQQVRGIVVQPIGVHQMQNVESVNWFYEKS